MNPTENDGENQNSTAETPNQKRVIQPLNAEEVKAHLAENSSPALTPQASSNISNSQETQSLYPSTDLKADDKTKIIDEEWKPNTPLSYRVPKLKIWGIVYIGAGILNAIINKNLLTLRNGFEMQPIVVILYLLMILTFISGLVFLFSKKKILVQLCLNGVLLFAILMTFVSLISISIIGIIFSVLFIGSVMSIKREVKAAA